MAKAKSKKNESQTPMMRQYMEIKADHQDAIVFYRLGDFYEMFFEDAIEASQICELTLTARAKNSDNPIPMCGVPHHASENYIAKLIKHGKKVVICDQVEDAAQAKGIVKRGVTRILTPGTILEDASLSAKRHNFVMSVHLNQTKLACVLCDVSTGRLEYNFLENLAALKDEVARLPIQEILFAEHLRNSNEIQELQNEFPEIFYQALSDLYFDNDFAADKIKTQFDVSDLSALSLESGDAATSAIGALLSHLEELKILKADLLDQPQQRFSSQFMGLDKTTLAHLELFETLSDDGNKGTLFWHLDHCTTAMGSRRLGDVVRQPLLDVHEIQKRQDAVDWLLNKPDLEDLKAELSQVADIERLVNKFIANKANPRDAVALKDSLIQSLKVRAQLDGTNAQLLHGLKAQIQDFSLLRKKIEKTLVDEPPMALKDGGIIREGQHKELDELREIEKSGKGYILKLEASERERTGIPSLKVRYNNVFGYYIEVTHTHKDKVPEDYIRKQTLTNAERYITPELKEYESKVLGASERIQALEYEIFVKLREEISRHAEDLKSMAHAISWIDVFQSLAHLAKSFNYTRPQITSESLLELKDARHPIIERMNLGEPYVPNDVILDTSGVCELIITGPNMAGKSTVMRMTALITLMAQMGSFVPCGDATVGICDRIFTRVGAHDSLQKGLSTFMVEMVETARILREATTKSLIILDEIGRGTSTFDGLSIAWAVAEDLHDRLRARTLFATHYHELCDLADQKKGIGNCHMQVKEYKDQIIFLRKLVAGGSNRSYGVAVAQMAGLSSDVVTRAKDIMRLLEKKDLSFRADLEAKNSGQISLFDVSTAQSDHAVVKKLQDIDVNALTPLEALNILSDLKNEAGS